jgi:hypothetical protein
VLATLAMIASVASTIITTAGHIRSQKAKEDAARYASLIAHRNQQEAEQAARQAIEFGQRQAKQAGLIAALKQKKERASRASGGVSVNEGTIIAELDYLLQQGKVEEKYDVFLAELEARRLRTIGQGFGDESIIRSASAANYRTTRYDKAGASLLGGISNVAWKWQALNPKPLTAGE